MKRMGWARPPVILGVVLGDIVERYLFISMGRYGTEWLWRPVVAVMLAIALIGILRPLLREFKAAGGLTGMFTKFSRPGFDIQTVFYFAFIALIGVMVYQATGWNFNAKIVPLIVGGSAMLFATISLLNYTFRKSSAGGAGEGFETNVKKSLHLDIAVDEKDLEPALVAKRAFAYLGWILGFMGVTALIGMLPTIAVFVIAYMRAEGREKWLLTSVCALGMTAASWFIFDQLLSLPWPNSVLGNFFPDLKNIIPSV